MSGINAIPAIILVVLVWMWIQMETGGPCSQFTDTPSLCSSDMKEGIVDVRD